MGVVTVHSSLETIVYRRSASSSVHVATSSTIFTCAKRVRSPHHNSEQVIAKRPPPHRVLLSKMLTRILIICHYLRASVLGLELICHRRRYFRANMLCA